MNLIREILEKRSMHEAECFQHFLTFLLPEIQNKIMNMSLEEYSDFYQKGGIKEEHYKPKSLSDKEVLAEFLKKNPKL
jgi:hypothetical protein